MSDDMIETLRAKESELERRVDSNRRKIEKLRSDLSTIRAMLLFHEQDISNEEFMPHMSVRRLFKGGEIFSYCRDAFEEAGSSLDTRQLTRYVIARKGLDPEDDILRKKIVFSVMQVMKSARRRRFVQGEGKRLGVRVWRYTPGRDRPPSQRTR